VHGAELVPAGSRLRIGLLRARSIVDGAQQSMKTVAFALALSTTACSFVTTSAPKDPPDPPSCSGSYGSPVLDVLGVFVGGPLVALVAWGVAENASTHDEDTIIAMAMGTTMIAFTISAIVGFSRVSRCNDAQDAYTGQMMMQNAQPQPYYAPPPVYSPPPPPLAEPPAGSERGLCRPDGTCDPGLTCASSRCVVLPTN
jgi:hypothetical protein